MAGWTCPECGRRFGGRNRVHMCEPAMTVDQFFAEAHGELRPMYDAIAVEVEGLDGVLIEPVQVGIFFKGTRTFAELRPKRDRRGRVRFELSVILRRRVEHPRVRRATRYSEMWVHYVDLYSVEDIDDAVLQLITESADAFGL